MPYSRKDMAVEAPLFNFGQEPKLAKTIDEGSAYVSLANNPGWRRLIEEFIKPAIDIKVIFKTKKDDRNEAIAVAEKLTQMLEFVQKKIEDSTAAFEQLQKLREEQK